MSIYHLYSKEEKVLEVLRDLLIREKDVLVKGNWQELNEIIEEKIKISDMLGKLEEKRLAVNEEILLNNLEDNLKKESLIIKDNIKKIILEIQRQNETNALLTKSSLNYTKTVLGSFGVNNKANTYGSNGRVGQTNGNINVSINKSI